MRKGGVPLPLQYDMSQVRSAITVQSNGGREIRRTFVRAKCGTFGQPSSEGRNSRTELAESQVPYECKSGIRLTTFPPFRAWTFSFSSSLEPVHRSGGVRFSVAQ